MTPPGSTLCLACGMCCDGTLFRFVELGEGEVEPWRRRGLPVVIEHDSPRFLQPCPHHRGGSCGIYEERPSICQTFRCPLLNEYTAGELSEEECLARVARAKALTRSVRARIGPAEVQRPLREEIRAHLDLIGAAAASESPEWRRRNAELLLDLKTLELLMKRDFLPPSC